MTSMRGGFSLMEVVISVGILAVVVPVIMGLLVAGGKSSRVAADETQAALIARSVVQEIRWARDGKGQKIGKTLTWPEFPGGSGRLVFSANADGTLLEQLEAGAYATGIRELEAQYLVSAAGVRHTLADVKAVDVLSRVVVSVETPPAAKPEHRRKFVFVQLMHRDD